MPINYNKHSHRQKDLNKEISDLIKSLKREKKKRFGFWEKAVGEKISEIAVPYRLKNDILLIKVTDSVWRFELTKRKEELLQSVNSNTENKIKDIIFK
jgi:predicted nucleic acid-binding Zn ribbon protein